jgi:hypothetical protein
MSTKKFGKCRLCPKDSPDKRLYGDGVCAYHLAHAADDMSKQRLEKEITEAMLTAHEKKLLNQFFQEQAKIRPLYCENRCGKKLIASETWRLKAFICHIVPKRDFKSVLVHPANRWFGCLDCHHDYDDKGWTFAVTMPVWPVVTERFKQFMTLIKDTEMTKLPDVFRLILEENLPT